MFDFQLVSGESICSLRMEGSGDALVPTNQTLVVQGPCEGVEISVTVRPPSSSLSHSTTPTTTGTGTTGSKKGGAASTSLVPQTRLRTSASGGKWVWPASMQTRRRTVVGDSIQRALDDSPDGATLLVPAGQYHENLNLTKPVTLVAASSVSRAPGSSSVVLFGRISISSTHDVIVDGISVYPVGPPSTTAAALEITSSSDVFVQNCRIAQDQLQWFTLRARNSSAILVRDSSRVHFTNMVISGHGGCGLSMDRCEHCAIQTSIFRACRNAVGVAGSDHLRLTGSYFRENMVVMLSPPEGPGEGLVVRGNLFEDNVHFAVSSSSDGSFVVPLAGGRGSDVPLSYLDQAARHGDTGSPARRLLVVVTGSCESDRAADDVPCVHMQGTNY